MRVNMYVYLCVRIRQPFNATDVCVAIRAYVYLYRAYMSLYAAYM